MHRQLKESKNKRKQTIKNIPNYYKLPNKFKALFKEFSIWSMNLHIGVNRKISSKILFQNYKTLMFMKTSNQYASNKLRG